MTEVFRTYITLALPMGDDPGRVEYGHYILDKDTVILTDDAGAPLTQGRMQLKYERSVREQTAEQVARQLIMQRYRANKRGSDFNRPIVYSRRGIV